MNTNRKRSRIVYECKHPEIALKHECEYLSTDNTCTYPLCNACVFQQKVFEKVGFFRRIINKLKRR